ncbi:branched-chain amino acid ABC transporter permease [Haloarchaeobius sp. DFWS5]|uniref:branched-chain amino acid ABC transporter permease n=1 Tax=Haloarchaeobius sp. DFWS5 TaxID=3446114 RepID=UPI003EC0468F
MVDPLTIIASGVMLSALYALIAIGFTMIFGVGGVLNLSHGANIVIGAYSAYYVTTWLDVSIWVGALAALLVPALFSLLMYEVLIRHVEDDPITVIILTLVVLLIVEQLFLVFEGTQPQAIPVLLGGKTDLLGITLQNNRLLVFGLSWILIGALFAFTNYTRTGMAIEATSMSKRGADLVGIDRRRMAQYTWIIAGMLAGISGLFLGSFRTASWNMGLDPLLLSFSIVILGGLGSVRGSVLGAYVIGFFEILTISVIDARLAGFASLVTLIAVLLVKPEGLFGHAEVEAA